MWTTIAPWLGGGAAGVLAWLGYKLHSDAVSAERRRADEWSAAYKAERARADLKEEQMGILLGRGKDPAS